MVKIYIAVTAALGFAGTVLSAPAEPNTPKILESKSNSFRTIEDAISGQEKRYISGKWCMTGQANCKDFTDV